MRKPRETVRAWVGAFNRADVEALAELYSEDAINHQVMWQPIVGRAAIREMFEREFARADMTCIVENLFEDGNWAILEWRDPTGVFADADSSKLWTDVFIFNVVTGISCLFFANKDCRFLYRTSQNETAT